MTVRKNKDPQKPVKKSIDPPGKEKRGLGINLDDLEDAAPCEPEIEPARLWSRPGKADA